MLGVVCDQCHSNLSQLPSEIALIHGLRSVAIEKIEKLIQPDKEIVKIRASNFFVGSIGSEDELKAYLQELQMQISKLLDEGKRVIIE
jgi:hypothetical protein